MEQPASGALSPRRREKLPRRQIIRRRTVIQGLRTQGKRQSNRWLVLLVQEAAGAEESQAAFFTPKRIGAAHLRNRLRRRMREVYRRFIAPEVTGEKRLWLWSARPEAASMTFVELKEAMLQLSDRQKISRRSS